MLLCIKFNLTEIQFDRRLPAKNGNHHLQLHLLLVHFLNEAAERIERTVDDAHRIADLVLNFRNVGGSAWSSRVV